MLEAKQPSVCIMIISLALSPQATSVLRSLQLRSDLHISGQLCNPGYRRATGHSTFGTVAHPRRTTSWASRFPNEAGLAWCASSANLTELFPPGLISTTGSTPECWHAAPSEWPMPLTGGQAAHHTQCQYVFSIGNKDGQTFIRQGPLKHVQYARACLAAH